MATKSKSKSDKEKLYDAFSTNLAFYRPEFKGLYGCPLCLRLFDREALFTGELTREHIIPSSIGGKLLTLTCRNCNNRSGTKLESHLKRQAQVIDILTGAVNDPLRAIISVGGVRQTADVYFSGDPSDHSLRIDGIPEQSDPEQIRQIVEALEGGVVDFKIQFSFGYKELPTRVAKIRIAYLMMFRQFGYGYIPSPHLNAVRELISTPTPDSTVLFSLFDLNDQKTPTAVGLLKKPEALRGFVCFMSLPTTTPQRFGVLFPGLDESSGNLFDILKERSKAGEKAEEMTATFFDFKTEHLTSPDFAGAPYRIWRTLANPL